MKLRGKPLVAALLLLFSIAIHFFSDNSTRVEYLYSTGFYPTIARILRFATGFVPFSLGDIVYGAAIIWLLIIVVKLIRNKQYWKGVLITFVIFCTSVYITFNLFWGINYNRKGIAYQLGLHPGKFSKEELKELNCDLIEKVNSAKASSITSHYSSNQQLFKETKKAFDAATKVYPFLVYKNEDIKSSFWGWFGNYAGFTGYYNPFSGEAQVNTTIPEFIIPFTSCHEVAHQVGYAKEMEANFVGYLAATASTDSFFHYSAYLDLFLYANKNLYYADSVAAKVYRKELSPAVEKDIQELIAFNRRHISVIEPVIRWIYGKYLQGNQQPKGIYSYDEVTGLMIAFKKKYAKI